MKRAEVRSRCECQAILVAEVDTSGRVGAGRAVREGETELAPATGIGVGQPQFQVGWLCPVCGRNTVRSFYTGALVYADAS